MEVAQYHDTDSSPEIEETRLAVIRFVFEGDDLDAPYDIRGLHVFAVISALREKDEELYGEEAGLTPEQQERLQKVEDEVDKAVEVGMHYYPWGDYQNKRNLDREDYGKLAAAKESRDGVRAGGSPGDRKNVRAWATRKEREKNDAVPVMPVVAKKRKTSE